MSRFPVPAQLAAWYGLAPGNWESAGKRMRAGTRKANKHLKAALVELAWSVARTRTRPGARFRRLARLGYQVTVTGPGDGSPARADGTARHRQPASGSLRSPLITRPPPRAGFAGAAARRLGPQVSPQDSFDCDVRTSGPRNRFINPAQQALVRRRVAEKRPVLRAWNGTSGSGPVFLWGFP